MVFLFFPSMAMYAFIFMGATIFIVVYERSWTPVWALVFRVYIKLWLSSKILPVMSKHTLITLMIIFIVGTPHCFKMKHVKVWILFKFINQFYWYLCIWMGKWTEVTILTFSRAINVWRTKFSFIFIRMIKFFYSVMSFLANFSIGTLLSFYSKTTHFWLIWT